ncbi:hypothetical protein BDV09DRAFT_176262 [Aspergillus tetrazonus]
MHGQLSCSRLESVARGRKWSDQGTDVLLRQREVSRTAGSLVRCRRLDGRSCSLSFAETAEDETGPTRLTLVVFLMGNRIMDFLLQAQPAGDA